VQALLLNKPLPPITGTSLEKLFTALQLLPKTPEKALELLQDTAKLPTAATNVRQYYRGIAALKLGNAAEVLQSWLSLNEPPPGPWLRTNLASLLTQQLENGLELQALEPPDSSLLNLAATNPALGDVLIAYLDRKAQTAAASGDWQFATVLWESARGIVSISTAFGSPRALTHNLALAKEFQENWLEAAEEWRALLRTRPRANAKTEASGEYSPEQWAWVRKKVIDCYKMADQPGEAVSLFRQAIKATPEDLELRMQFVEALVANEQPQAAHNELHRIIELDPDHFEAQLRLVEVEVEGGMLSSALGRLRSLQAKYPEREELRRQLASLLLKYGEEQHNNGYYQTAQKTLEEGQKLVPDDYHFPLALARLALDQKIFTIAEELLETALTLGKGQAIVYSFVVDCWTVADKIDKVRQVVTRFEAELSPTTEHYAQMAMMILKRKSGRPEPDIFAILGRPNPLKPKTPPSPTPWENLAQELVDKAIQLNPKEAQTYNTVAALLTLVRPDLALPYAREAVGLDPNDPNSYVNLGLTLAFDDQMPEAKKILKQGANLARKQNKPDLAHHIESMSREIDSPLFGMLKSMGGASSLFDMFDDDYDNDEFF
jgi:tetratricopeptide (TPR) repeat protein